MYWVEDKSIFTSAYERARECAATDSGRLSTFLQKLTFNDVDVLSKAFAKLLQKLLEWSGDRECAFVVLRPDPIYYFHHFFGSYPLVQIRQGMTDSEYLAILNEGPLDSKAEALGTVYAEYVFTPPSRSWFIHALRSARDDGGHLWIPSEWLDKVAEIYPHATR